MINTHDAVHVERICHDGVGDTVPACEIITGIEDIHISITSQSFLLRQIFTEGPIILHGDYVLEDGLSSGTQNAMFSWRWGLGSWVT